MENFAQNIRSSVSETSASDPNNHRSQNAVENKSEHQQRHGHKTHQLVRIIIDLFREQKYCDVILLANEADHETKKSIIVANILAEAHSELGNYVLAIQKFGKVLNCNPNSEEKYLQIEITPYVLNNIGICYKKLGLLDLAEEHLKAAISKKPNFSQAHYNLAGVYQDQAFTERSKLSFIKALEYDPDNPLIFWHLHSFAKNKEMAEKILAQAVEKDPKFSPALSALAGMQALNGNVTVFKELLENSSTTNSMLSSFAWLLSLDEKPVLGFNRWSMFDLAARLSNKNRPCYEFGVWTGKSIKYLMNFFPSGYGFDTFDGLPEDWGTVPRGSYSSFSVIPKIRNVEFIPGEFSKSLPRFFAKKRQAAGLINFDADTYASTFCALSHCSAVIDEETTLIFDEFIVNEGWEKDEFLALQHFCEQNGWQPRFEAVSIFSNQAICKLKKISL